MKRLALALVAFVLVLTACGVSKSDIQHGVEGARDVIDVAEPCMVAMQAKEIEACTSGASTDEACVARVKKQWAPVADALDAFHALWCTVSPSSEGCS